MKKIFTLVSIAFCAMSVNAQEAWYVNNEDGTLKAEYVANPDPSAMSVVEFATANVTGTHTSGPVAGYKDGPSVPLEQNVDNTWGGIQTKALSADGSVAPFYYVQGKGNPVNLEKIDFEEVVTDGVGTGTFRALWDDSYYSPDGANGLPTNGTYVTLTPKVAGTMKVAVWINKGNRDIYVVKASDAKALALGTEVIASGYVNGTNWADTQEGEPLHGYPMLQENIAPKGTEGSDAYVVGAGNQAAWVYLTFNTVAGETYYVFNKNTQVGFSGFEFTAAEGGDNGEGGIDAEELWTVANEDGTLKAEYVANEDASAMSVVEFATANVTGTHTSGPVAGYKDGPSVPLEQNVDNTWGGIQTKALSADGSVAPFYYVQGKGNPVNLEKIDFEEVVTDGVGTGTFRALWDDSYYSPDGANGLPTNGTYITLTPKVAGTMKVAVWINKGNRDIYVVKASDAKALALGTEVIASGYVNGANWDVEDDSPLKGYPMLQENIAPKGTEGSDAYVVGAGNQAAWVYLTFNAVAGETYYVFNKNTQVGFSGFGFTPAGGTGISEVITVNDDDAPVYNLAGQRVSKDTKGILIKNGKKFFNK